MLAFWGMRGTPSLLSLPGPLWPGVAAPDKGPIASKRVILVEDWNGVLDPNLDRGAINVGTNTLDARYFREFVERLDLVDKFRERHPNKVV